MVSSFAVFAVPKTASDTQLCSLETTEHMHFDTKEQESSKHGANFKGTKKRFQHWACKLYDSIKQVKKKG